MSKLKDVQVNGEIEEEQKEQNCFLPYHSYEARAISQRSDGGESATFMDKKPIQYPQRQCRYFVHPQVTSDEKEDVLNRKKVDTSASSSGRLSNYFYESSIVPERFEAARGTRENKVLWFLLVSKQ